MQTAELKLPAFYPVVRLTNLERFYTAYTALILNSCFNNRTLNDLLIQADPSLNTINTNLAGQNFRRIDIVFDLNTMRAGEVLHACSPLFKLPYQGISKSLMTRTLAMLLSARAIIDDVFNYTGLPALLEGERV